MTDIPLIEFRGIGKRYGTGEAAFTALHSIDLTIHEGEFVAIMGPSGSGKSTAMNIIGALDRPSWGEYLFEGVHVENLSNDERAMLRRRYIGFVFQGFNLLPRTTALENVELPLLYRGLKRTARSSPLRRSIAWGSPTGRTTRRQSFRAASSSASPLPGQSSSSRSCSWQTNQQGRSIAREALKS